MTIAQFLRLSTFLLVIQFITGCQNQALPTPTRLVQLDMSGTIREYWVHDPFPERRQAVPLVIALHGLDSDGYEFMRTAGLFSHAREAGYVVLAPNALGGAFNDGSGRSSSKQDDIALIERAVKRLSGSRRIDPSRIYAVGFSTGASMAMRLALESTNLELSGIGLVADHLWVKATSVNKPVPAIFMFGDQDPFNPRDGGAYRFNGRQLKAPPTSFTPRNWARMYSCQTTVSAEMANAKHTGRYGCDGDISVVFLEIENHGHYWPRVPGERELLVARHGPIQSNIAATRIIWKFFQRQ